ncbi:LysR substrate-binding domain-containing protein [Streptomyces sp. NPDC006368]|uniref:LysR substrate-binding domain-containing protein n=1 Tax=Streptomyces sp. NPDC006368 TaxID=3156760 RepID=UPI0033BC5E8F
MELRHLEYFVAVAEERHFTRAAARLMVSQSGLSAAIRALERELGAPLFVRSTRTVALTEAGRALLGEAGRALASVRAAREAVAATQGLLRGTLAVGTEQCVSGVHVPSLLAAFRQRHPRVEIRLRQAGSVQLMDEVAAGRLDVAFLLPFGDPPPRVRLSPLADEPMTLLCHPDHPLAGTGAEAGTGTGIETGARTAPGAGAAWSALADEPFVDFHPDWGTRRITDRAFAAARVQRQVTLEVNDVHSLLELVQEGLGIALVPQHFTAKPQAAGLRAVPLDALPGGHRPAYVSSAASAGETATSPAAQALLSLLTPPTHR